MSIPPLRKACTPHQICVLVVEDDAFQRGSISAQLAQLRYHCKALALPLLTLSF